MTARCTGAGHTISGGASLRDGYANLLGPDDREQARAAYGDNAAQLRGLKRRFDPDGVFASAIPLPEE